MTAAYRDGGYPSPLEVAVRLDLRSGPEIHGAAFNPNGHAAAIE
jgi:hypothetical protein